MYMYTIPVCPDGESVVECDTPLPCDRETCEGFPTARCVNDNCRECRARFYDPSGEEITSLCRDGVCVCLVCVCVCNIG